MFFLVHFIILSFDSVYDTAKDYNDTINYYYFGAFDYRIRRLVAMADTSNQIGLRGSYQRRESSSHDDKYGH